MWKRFNENSSLGINPNKLKGLFLFNQIIVDCARVYQKYSSQDIQEMLSITWEDEDYVGEGDKSKEQQKEQEQTQQQEQPKMTLRKRTKQ